MFKFTGIVILDLTEGCNIGCKYCLMLNKDKHYGEVMPFETFKQIINKIIHQRILNDLADTPLTLVFHGGEPFSVGKANFYRFAEYAYTAFRNHGVNVNFGTQTNGTFLDEEYLRILRKFGFSLGLSLDDLGPGNDLRIEDSEEFMREKLDIIEKSDIDSGIISVVTKQNVKTLPEFWKKIDVEYENIHGVTLLQFENPDATTNAYDYAATAEDYLPLYTELIWDFSHGKTTDAKLGKGTFSMALSDILTDHNPYYQSGCGGKFCGTAIGMISVRPDGWFGNCDRFPDETEFNNLLRVEDYDYHSIVQLKRAFDMARIKHDLVLNRGCDRCPADYFCSHGCMTFDYPALGEFTLNPEVCDLFLHIYHTFNDNLIEICRNIASGPQRVVSTETIYSIKPEIKQRLLEGGIAIEQTGERELSLTLI